MLNKGDSQQLLSHSKTKIKNQTKVRLTGFHSLYNTKKYGYIIYIIINLRVFSSESPYDLPQTPTVH